MTKKRKPYKKATASSPSLIKNEGLPNLTNSDKSNQQQRLNIDEPSNEVTQETWLALANMSQESFLNRRAMEWKSAFGLWTAIGAWTYFSVNNAERLTSLPLDYAAYLLIALGVILLFGWQLPLRRAFEEDKHWKHYYMHRAEGIKDERPTSAGYFIGLLDSRHFPWTASQMGTTIIFLLASWLATAAAIERALNQPIVRPVTTSK